MLARLSVLATIWGNGYQRQLPRMEPPLIWIATHGYLGSTLRSELFGDKPHPVALPLRFHSWKKGGESEDRRSYSKKSTGLCDAMAQICAWPHSNNLANNSICNETTSSTFPRRGLLMQPPQITRYHWRFYHKTPDFPGLKILMTLQSAEGFAEDFIPYKTS